MYVNMYDHNGNTAKSHVECIRTFLNHLSKPDREISAGLTEVGDCYFLMNNNIIHAFL